MDRGKGSHLVSWEVVRCPINQGGLEIGNIRGISCKEENSGD